MTVRVLTPQQMRAADAQAVERLGNVALMRAAGKRIAEAAKRYARNDAIVAFAGPGNNGGDAFSALAYLDGYHRDAYAQIAPQPSRARLDAEERARAAGVRFHAFPDSREAAHAALEKCGLAIVGLVGTAARLPLPASYAPLFSAIESCGVPALAIDIPPGVNGETGAVVAPALHASLTVTLGALKPGLLLDPGRERCGDLWLAAIGIPDEVLSQQPAAFQALDDDAFQRLLPARKNESDKRSAGAPLIVAGSEQFPGAAVLCAMGAARSGAGYVTVATPTAAASALRSHLLEQVVVTIDTDKSVDAAIADLLDLSKRCSSAGIGPGLALDDRTGEIVRGFAQASTLPIVADASALFHFAKHLEPLRGKPIVLTPHAGEFARLSGKGTIKPGERVARLREFVERTGITTLLKGRSTLICDGGSMHVNTTGTAALSTAGTGDVLTGIIATLLAQGLSPIDAACAGAYWHGLAGRSAAAHRARGVIARDVYESLAQALPQTGASADLVRIF